MATEAWQKSSYCAEASNCLEVRLDAEGMAHIRESTSPGEMVTLPAAGLGAMLRAVRTGQVHGR
ncbi:hypothetical protein N566_21150 [Streptomycetaceae bacterium MP113-05]|nr:hypothetical protein N566_21150 [Streptomycetaceae bacterium MP113-05]